MSGICGNLPYIQYSFFLKYRPISHLRYKNMFNLIKEFWKISIFGVIAQISRNSGNNFCYTNGGIEFSTWGIIRLIPENIFWFQHFRSLFKLKYFGNLKQWHEENTTHLDDWSGFNFPITVLIAAGFIMVKHALCYYC